MNILKFLPYFGRHHLFFNQSHECSILIIMFFPYFSFLLFYYTIDWLIGKISDNRLPGSSQSQLESPMHSFVYSSGYCCMWRSRMQGVTFADTLFVLSKPAYFDSATTDQLLTISLRDFVLIKHTAVSMSYRNSGWIRQTILKLNSVKTSHFMEEI